MKIKISEIKIKENVRKDLGDLTELTASIKEKGVLDPLIISDKNVLMDGHRRLKAATAAGLEDVPYIINDSDEISEIQLITVLHRKDLDPVEEGEAFRKYIDETGHTDKYLAKKISKKIDFIQRRLVLSALDNTVKKALHDKKIKLGHAVIMSKYKPKRQRSMLKDIGNYYGGTCSVEDFADELCEEDTIGLTDASFDQKECKTCQYNGGHQALLTDTEGQLKDQCLHPICFRKKQQEYINTRIDELEKQNVHVMSLECIKGIPGARIVENWQDDYAAAKKAIYNGTKKSTTFAVAVVEKHGRVDEEIWRIADKKSDGKEISQEEEIRKKANSLGKLKYKVSDFKHDLLREKGNHHLQGGLMTKRFLAWSLFDQFEYTGSSQAVETLKAITLMNSKQLDKFIKKHSEGVFQKAHGRILEDLAAFSGADLNEDFVMSEEYLQLYTKEQLMDLAKEFKIELLHAKKNKDIILTIVENWKKGQVPKILKKKLE